MQDTAVQLLPTMLSFHCCHFCVHFFLKVAVSQTHDGLCCCPPLMKTTVNHAPPLFVGSLSSMVSFCLLTLDSCRASCSSVMCLLLHCASPLHVLLYHLLVLPAAAIFLYFFGFLAAYDIFVVTSVATSLVRVLTVLPRGDVRVTALTSPR